MDSAQKLQNAFDLIPFDQLINAATGKLIGIIAVLAIMRLVFLIIHLGLNWTQAIGTLFGETKHEKRAVGLRKERDNFLQEVDYKVAAIEIRDAEQAVYRTSSYSEFPQEFENNEFENQMSDSVSWTVEGASDRAINEVSDLEFEIDGFKGQIALRENKIDDIKHDDMLVCLDDTAYQDERENEMNYHPESNSK